MPDTKTSPKGMGKYMKIRYFSVLFLALLGKHKKKTIRLTEELDSYLSKYGRVNSIARMMAKKSGHPHMVTIDRENSKLIIQNSDVYITKGKLLFRWSESLVKKYFQEPTLTLPNPYYRKASPMCLYSMTDIKRIEGQRDFQRELRMVAIRRAAKRSQVLTQIYTNR